eukprot:m.185086 g.185086  ORF g.185086 m.185086 type:complete len:51 (-) comp14725_c2_seq10:883-1035(-)
MQQCTNVCVWTKGCFYTRASHHVDTCITTQMCTTQTPRAASSVKINGITE